MWMRASGGRARYSGGERDLSAACTCAVPEKLIEYTQKGSEVFAMKRALVFSGGGSRGAYEIGAWQAMRDLEGRDLSPKAQTRLIWPCDPAQNKSYAGRVAAFCPADG